MGKRKNKAKRSLAALPKGLPLRKSNGDGHNPFDVSKRQRRAKHEVLNRVTNATTGGRRQSGGNGLRNKPSKLALSLQRRQEQMRAHLQSTKKANSFVDKRIGRHTMTEEQQMVARLVKERSRRSRKASKFQLNDDNDGNGLSGFGGGGGANDGSLLTHKGRAIDELDTRDHVILSSDDEDGGNLDADDTELHFGGMRSTRDSDNPYGPQGGQGDGSMAQTYSRRKTELDDLIATRKAIKAEKMQVKEKQVETFESMDSSFKELSQLLQFRDKEKEREARVEARRQGQQTEEEKEMADWDKEMKGYLFERRVKATDRVKTPEEIAKEESERLHELETRRLARMNGDFQDDDLSDVSDGEEQTGGAYQKKKKQGMANKRVKDKNATRNPDALDDEDDDDDDDGAQNDGDGLTPKFTADGLVYVDKEGKVVKHSSDKADDGAAGSDDTDDNESDDENEDNNDGGIAASSIPEYDPSVILSVGDRVTANYHVKDQVDGEESWFVGKITAINNDVKKGGMLYDVEYDDGDFEEGIEPINLRPVAKSKEETTTEELQKAEAANLRKKRQKAKEQARKAIPFVLEVPTTLEALHDVIGLYASTGEDVSLIIHRIHTSNSVRLDHRNKEKMQNFYDVLLRRFVAVGDAAYRSGNGGDELDRYGQLDALTKTLYRMSQDSPDCAGAVWGRRLKVFQSAHAKRLRDAELGMYTVADSDNNNNDDDDENEEDENTVAEYDRTPSSWPSLGTLLLLKAMGHIFPVTDRRHPVVTPGLILLGQVLAQTPVRSLQDVAKGIFCCGLMVEHTKAAQRIAPEALAFLSGVVNLYSPKDPNASLPNLQRSECRLFDLRKQVATVCNDRGKNVTIRLRMERQFLEDPSNSPSAACALLFAALHVLEVSVGALQGAVNGAEAEVFVDVTRSLLSLRPTSKKQPLPSTAQKKAVGVADTLSGLYDRARPALRRRAGLSRAGMSIKSLAPRIEDPSRYSMSKDKKKTAVQAAIDRTRREYKREHKAVSRELRMDGSFVENERRREKATKDDKARAKRQKNFAWLEGEQAAMNQQVRQGGGLLSGGGIGVARAKAQSGKIGYKRGGKF